MQGNLARDPLSCTLLLIPLMLIANPTSVPWAGELSIRTAHLSSVQITACTQGWLKTGTILLFNTCFQILISNTLNKR